jgi:hypothetical protein
MGLFAGQKWCISRKPGITIFWPSPECWKPFSMLPRHALSSIMVWNAGDGLWWAPTDEIKKTSGSAQPLRAQSCSTNNSRRIFNETEPLRLTREANSYILVRITNMLIKFSKRDATPNGSAVVPDRKWHFSLPKGGPKPDLHPRTPDLHKKRL